MIGPFRGAPNPAPNSTWCSTEHTTYQPVRTNPLYGYLNLTTAVLSSKRTTFGKHFFTFRVTITQWMTKLMRNYYAIQVNQNPSCSRYTPTPYVWKGITAYMSERHNRLLACMRSSFLDPLVQSADMFVRCLTFKRGDCVVIYLLTFSG